MRKTKRLFAPDDGAIPASTTETEATRRVLLVEPDVVFSGALTGWLQARKYHVTQARDANDGLMCANWADFDYILCEMELPDQPGDQFYTTLQRAKPQMCNCLVFMCGPRGASRMEAFLARTRALILWKPFELQTTLDAFGIIDRKQRAAVV